MSSERTARAERWLDELDAPSRGRFERWSGPPLPMLSPASEDEAAAALRAACAAGLVVLPVGLGTKADWCPLPPRVDVALSTARLVGTVAYEPAEGVVTARAGTRVAELAALLARDGQRLAPDVAHPERTTLGGAFAAAQGGADRLRRGTWRDAVLGLRVLEPSGAITASGGRLVKNVTGYDLFRVHAGAHGALGIALELSLRLFADPPERAWLERDEPDAEQAVRSLLLPWKLGVPVTRLVLRGRVGAGFVAAALVEGRPRALRSVREALSGAFAPVRELTGDDARARAEAWRDAEGASGADGRARWPLVELFGKPSDAARLCASAERAARAAELPVELVAEPAIARVAVLADGAPDERTVRAFADALDVDPRDARWRAAPAALRAELAGPPPEGHEIMARLVAAQDPAGVLARGRAHPSL